MFDITACLHALNTNNEVVRIIVESLCNLSEIHLLLFFQTFRCQSKNIWIFLNDLSGFILFWKAVCDVCPHLMDSQ